MRRSALALLLLLSAACAHGPAQRSGPGVLFAPAELARQSGLEPWAISMPFDHGQDGTELVLRFLDRAEASGARFVSDVQVVFMAEEDGQPLECRTRLVPEGTARNLQKGMRTAKADARPALTLVERPVSSVAFGCIDTRVARLQTESYTDPVPRPATNTRATTQTHPFGNITQCGYHNVVKNLTRYAFEDAVNYVPPELSRIQEARPALRIEETRAECLPRLSSAPTVNRIEAIAYGGSGPKAAMQALPDVMPVRLDL
jgi:hypothetical protein